MLCHCLILWDEIETSREWVERRVPDVVHLHLHLLTSDRAVTGHVDIETVGQVGSPCTSTCQCGFIRQAYCSIVAGACFAIALRFAGTGDACAYATMVCPIVLLRSRSTRRCTIVAC